MAKNYLIQKIDMESLVDEIEIYRAYKHEFPRYVIMNYETYKMLESYKQMEISLLKVTSKVVPKFCGIDIALSEALNTGEIEYR